jgi:hypothetical protein
MKNKNNKIPSISVDRLDTNDTLKTTQNFTKEEQNVNSFLKGRESVQAITLRLPNNMYKHLRQVAFQKEIKINKIIVKLVSEYLANNGVK